MSMEFVLAQPQDLPTLEHLIFTYGPNPWNWLPTEGVQAHMRDIAQGRAQALLACEEGALVAGATFCRTHQFNRYQGAAHAQDEHGYVCEVVVRPDHAGRGLGAQMLRLVVNTMAQAGLQTVYIDRHEENLASAGMMRKAGFEEVDTFAEPARRPHGSGRTTVCRIELARPDPG